jgi:hypothetical protein
MHKQLLLSQGSSRRGVSKQTVEQFVSIAFNIAELRYLETQPRFNDALAAMHRIEDFECLCVQGEQLLAEREGDTLHPRVIPLRGDQAAFSSRGA